MTCERTAVTGRKKVTNRTTVNGGRKTVLRLNIGESFLVDEFFVFITDEFGNYISGGCS